MRRTQQHDGPRGNKLRQTGPGLYVDETGAEYFYLTGLFPWVAQHLSENRLSNRPALVVNILDELRTVLHELCHTELVD